MKRYLLIFVAGVLVTGVALAGDTEWSGFVDAAYFHNVNEGAGEFGLDQVELNVQHRPSDKTFVRADLEWLKAGEDDFEVNVEQAFLTYTCGAGWAFSLGRFNAPIGFELLDPPDMYQYSHSLVFDFGLPSNLTGISVGKDLGHYVDVLAYVVNGWDQNIESNKLKTYGGRLGYSRGDFGGGLSIIGGKEGGDIVPEFNRTVFDIDLSYEPTRWVFGGEFNSGTVDLASGDQEKWTAFLVMARRVFNDWFGLTGRYDWFDDKDGHAFGLVGGNPQTRQSITLAPTFVLDDNLGALFELRFDLSDQDNWTDTNGEPTDSETTFAFEMTYAW